MVDRCLNLEKQLVVPHDPFETGAEFIHGKGFADEFGGSCVHRIDVGEIRVAGDHYGWQVRFVLMDFMDQLDTVHARHADVRHHCIEIFVFGFVQGNGWG